MIGDYCSVREAAVIIGCTEGHVRMLISMGKIQSEKFGERMNIIHIREVDRVRDIPYRTGRPRKKIPGGS